MWTNQSPGASHRRLFQLARRAAAGKRGKILTATSMKGRSGRSGGAKAYFGGESWHAVLSRTQPCDPKRKKDLDFFFVAC